MCNDCKRSKRRSLFEPPYPEDAAYVSGAKMAVEAIVRHLNTIAEGHIADYLEKNSTQILEDHWQKAVSCD